MKTINHLEEYKSYMSKLGKQFSISAYYKEKGKAGKNLTAEDFNYISLHYEGGLLQSVAKQLDIECNFEIVPTKLEDYGATYLQLSIYVPVQGYGVETIDLGMYFIKSVEKQEDTNTYKAVCYDAMFVTMQDYVDMGITYPITVRDYITEIARYLHWNFKNWQDTFANYDKEIPRELYLDSDGKSLGYTFRDVLTELAQVVGGVICVDDSTNALEIRYINDTNDTIDENLLKDVNVNFGNKFGPINSLVLSRSADADITNPVEDSESIAENGICQIKISDNQILNWDDRETYMQEIFDKIKSIEYYINDFTSTGILYYELLDKYNVTIGDTTYNCIMLNDEIELNSGIQEYINADEMGEYVADIKKSDKENNKINKISLIVNKQEGVIKGLVDETEDLRKYQKTVTGTNNVILTNTQTSNGAIGRLEISNFNDLSLYPSMTYPSSTTYPGKMTTYIIVTTNGSTIIDETYIDLNTQLSGTDKLIIDNGKVYISRNDTLIDTEKVVGINTYDNETTLYVKYFDNLNYVCNYIVKNDFTTRFATIGELNSSITQTADSINLQVNKKLDSEDFTGANIILAINQDESEASIMADKIDLKGKEINLTSDDITIESENFKVTKTGVVTANSFNSNNANITGGTLKLNDGGASSYSDARILLQSNSEGNYAYFTSGQFYLQKNGYSANLQTGSTSINYYIGKSNVNLASIGSSGIDYTIGTAVAFSVRENGVTFIRDGKYINWGPYSLEKFKKNISKTKICALDLINNTDIYEYEYKEEEQNGKKHIGLIIGEDYKTPKEIISNTKDSIDLYAMISISWKAIKEQQEIIEQLKERIEKLERESGK